VSAVLAGQLADAAGEGMTILRLPSPDQVSTAKRLAELTTGGILRQPSWRGLRIDKEPGEAHREDPL
jgi:hypothetical protein